MMTADTQLPPDQQLARVRRYQEILVDFSRTVPGVSEQEEICQLAAVQAARGIGIGHSKVLRYRLDFGDLLIVAGVGWKPGVVGHAKLGSDIASVAGRAVQTREPVVSDDVPNDPEYRYSSILREHGIVSVLNVPIVAGGQVWGVLEVDSELPGHFGTDDLQFLSAMGNILGLAIHTRQANDKAAQAAADTALTLSREKTLFCELLHRTKNDFQLVIAMLTLQKRKQVDERALRAFSHVIDRVSAIGLAHSYLSAQERSGSIEFGGYLHALCGNLDQRSERVRVEADLDRAELLHQRAVALGLIVNELVVNALKHAFPGGREGLVRVTFRVGPVGEGNIMVVDDGVGMGPPRSGSSGLELVSRLVRQIGGQIETESSERGTAVYVRFVLAP